MNGDIMLNRTRDPRRLLLSFPLVWLVMGCDLSGTAPISEDAGSSSSSTGSSSGDPGPCGMDCSQVETPPCLISICNTGQVLGPVNTCVIVPAPDTTGCDDGKFCSVGDHCDGNGTCVGGGTNHCGIKPEPCTSVICYEELQKCDTTPVSDGDACTPTNLCMLDGICKLGECIGVPKDCSFSPLSECNFVGCDPATGKCLGTPDPAKDTHPCVLTGDPCRIHKICQAGACIGGEPKDCSGLTSVCELGACDSNSGLCVAQPAPIGTPCTDQGLAECQVGTCDQKGVCLPSSALDGSECNDYDACTKSDKCMGGACVPGNPVASCSVYLHEGFEVCANGWTLGGDWECGKPENVGPASARLGTGVIGTQIAGNYHVNQSYNVAVADTPPLDLTGATNPMVSFWAWQYTEGGSFDGWNLKISTNGGQSFTQVATVTPAYNLTIATQPAWGGDHASEGWQPFIADLTAYAGQNVILRFSFRSDGATVYPGVYIDEVVAAEPPQIPLYVTTPSPLLDVYSGMAYAEPMTRFGGSPAAVWSIKPNGVNTAWLKIDSTTGLLYGTPAPADVGPVEVTVHVEEPTLPSNFAEKTFFFNVKPNSFYASFEGMCPADWTLTGDWECGTPSGVGPAAAYIGTQCLATKIGGVYSNLQTYAATTATSPEIDLTNVAGPTLTFRMWIDTEGSTYDGVNLQVSTDGGMTYSLVSAVLPAYNLTVAMQPAWGGHQAGAGWQLFQSDLSAYAGKKIKLRFAFQSDSSGVFPGAYIDDIFIN